MSFGNDKDEFNDNFIGSVNLITTLINDFTPPSFNEIL